MKQSKTIGWLLITGVMGVLVPYLVLSSQFDYPAILREDAGTILTRFHNGGSGLVFTWLAFALLGLPLVVAYVLLGDYWKREWAQARWVTVLGVVSGVVQIIGLLRWVFVVPMLADTYVQGSDAATRAAVLVTFKTVHQFGGVLLGEHLGQLLTVIWSVAVSVHLLRSGVLPKWMGMLGLTASLIYFVAQLELLATVMPGLAHWEMAGFLGSTLWLVWLICVGVGLIRKGDEEKKG